MSVPSLSESPAPASQPSSRIESLDQFRGFTVLAMFLVNFLGNFEASPEILKHSHDYCSFADLVMPQFLFAAGFALRLSFVRQVAKYGRAAAWHRMARRILGLMGVAIFWYSYSNAHSIASNIDRDGLLSTLGWLLKRGWFQTLMHIAVTTAWVLPVLESSLKVRLAFAGSSLLLHTILSAWFNFHWVYLPPLGIDGGPFGFLTWIAPTIAGTWACDLMTSRSQKSATSQLMIAGLAVASLGWLLSSFTTLYAAGPQTTPLDEKPILAASPVVPSSSQLSAGTLTLPELPFVPSPSPEKRLYNYWMMSQRAGTASYLLFTAGTSCIVFAVFVVLCDRWSLSLPIFRTFGTNALAGYVIHEITATVTQAFIPQANTPLPILTGLVVFLGLTWWILRWLEKSKIHIRM